MTPDLQGQRSMSPSSGGSSPLTQRKRFPTSSGRASTAMAPRRLRKHPPEKTSRPTAPQSLAVYDIKPTRWGESNARKKIKKWKQFADKEAKPGDLNARPVSTRSSVSLFFSRHEKSPCSAAPHHRRDPHWCFSAGSRALTQCNMTVSLRGINTGVDGTIFATLHSLQVVVGLECVDKVKQIHE